MKGKMTTLVFVGREIFQGF